MLGGSMFTLKVHSSSGKEVKITTFNDGMLVFSVPYLIVSALWYFLASPIIYFLRKFILAPPRMLMVFLDKLNLLNIKFLIVLSMLVIATVFILEEVGIVSDYIRYLLMLVFWITGGMAIISLENYAQFFAKILDDNLSQKYIYPLTGSICQKFPKGLKVDKRTMGIFVANIILTVFVVYCLIFMAMLAENPGWIFWGLFLMLYSFYFSTDYEPIEHIASHSPKGKLISIQNPGVREYLYVGLNWLRRYVVWNFFAFWQADKYYYTHTFHHHVENNGPADWQSTIRFDQTSFLDFSKSILWFGLAGMFPFETWRYFNSMGKKKQARDLLISQGTSYFTFGVIFYLLPALGATLFLVNFFSSGLNIYIFVHRWHGFHDYTKPYGLEASNNNVEHYGHHKKQNVHIFAMEDLQEVFKKNMQKNPNEFRVYKTSIWWNLPRFEFDMILIRSLLWQNKVGCIRNIIIHTENETDDELRKYVCGCNLTNRKRWLKKLDRKISSLVGRKLEQFVRPITTDQTLKMCYQI